ncbi:MAG: GntR family transcriptional regulator [bacterium]
MIEIDRNSPTPIFRQIEDYILQEIQNGDLGPGDRIPSQYELARQCQVSRATVQKALDRLIQEEMLYYQPGKGIYVAEHGERQRLPILQSVGQSLRSLGYTVRADLLLVEEIPASHSVGQALQLPEKTEMIHIKRLLYVNDEPIMLQDVYVEAERFRAIRDYDLRQESLMEILQEIDDLYLAGSSVALGSNVANWEDSRTLNVQPSSPLLTVEEIDFDEERPFRFSRNKLRGDRFRAVASTLQELEISLEYGLQPGTISIALL